MFSTGLFHVHTHTQMHNVALTCYACHICQCLHAFSLGIQSCSPTLSDPLVSSLMTALLHVSHLNPKSGSYICGATATKKTSSPHSVWVCIIRIQSSGSIVSALHIARLTGQCLMLGISLWLQKWKAAGELKFTPSLLHLNFASISASMKTARQWGGGKDGKEKKKMKQEKTTRVHARRMHIDERTRAACTLIWAASEAFREWWLEQIRARSLGERQLQKKSPHNSGINSRNRVCVCSLDDCATGGTSRRWGAVLCMARF